MRVLSWNLYHGRALPGTGRGLLNEYAALIGSWEWDVALLQEVPPWWPALLPCDDSAMVLTSRNVGLALREAIAKRAPDAIKSNGGGANAILVRGGRIEATARRRLRVWPERRVVHGVLFTGVWVANIHSQVRPHSKTRRDNLLAAASVRRWAGDAPAIIGGDFNVTDPVVPGFERAGGRGVDHVFARHLRRARARTLERGSLSDHPPIWVEVEPIPREGDT